MQYQFDLTAIKQPMLLLLGDVHLDEAVYASGKRPLVEDPRIAFATCVDLALQSHDGICFRGVVAPGDLVNRRVNPSGPVAFFCRQMDRLERANIPFYYIRGNHDDVEPPWPSVHRWPKHLDMAAEKIVSPALKHGPYPTWYLYGLDHRSRADFLAALAEVPVARLPPDRSLLVCHQSFEGWMRSQTNPEASFESIPHFTRVHAGDFHHAGYGANPIIEERYGKDGQKMIVTSAGGTYLRAINEPWQKYAIVMSWTGELYTVPLPGRPVLGWYQLLTAEEKDDFTRTIRQRVAEQIQRGEADNLPLVEPIVAVCHNPKLITEDEIYAALGGRGILMAYEMTPDDIERGVRPGQDEPADEDEDSDDAPYTLETAVAEAEMPQEVRDLLTRSLRAEDKAAEFQRWQQENLNVVRGD